LPKLYIKKISKEKKIIENIQIRIIRNRMHSLCTKECLSKNTMLNDVH